MRGRSLSDVKLKSIARLFVFNLFHHKMHVFDKQQLRVSPPCSLVGLQHLQHFTSSTRLEGESRVLISWMRFCDPAQQKKKKKKRGIKEAKRGQEDDLEAERGRWRPPAVAPTLQVHPWTAKVWKRRVEMNCHPHPHTLCHFPCCRWNYTKWVRLKTLPRTSLHSPRKTTI